MKTLTARSLIIGGWIVAGLSMPLSAFADSSSALRANLATALQPETAQVDDSPAGVRQVKPTLVQPQSKPLQGGVTKLEDLLKATESTDLYKMAVDKLTKGIELTAEEYRSLGVGCFGMETDRKFFQNIAVISDVYRDSPADKAGLRKGDKLLVTDDNDDAAKEHPEIPRWKVSFGQAGTQAQYTLIKHHKQVTITLTRMNIEDIADDKTRHEWEQMVSKLGNPGQGDFEGVGTNPLSYKATNDEPENSR